MHTEDDKQQDRQREQQHDEFEIGIDFIKADKLSEFDMDIESHKLDAAIKAFKARRLKHSNNNEDVDNEA